MLRKLNIFSGKRVFRVCFTEDHFKVRNTAYNKIFLQSFELNTYF